MSVVMRHLATALQRKAAERNRQIRMAALERQRAEQSAAPAQEPESVAVVEEKAPKPKRKTKSRKKKAEPVGEPTGAICPKCGRQFRKSVVPHFHVMKCMGDAEWAP